MNGTVTVLLRRRQHRPGIGSDGRLLGPCEERALEAALGFARGRGSSVAAIAVGPARREDLVLLHALRRGCQRALRVEDDDIAELDYFALSRVLAAAVRYVGSELVFCGDRSWDEGSGAIGPSVAGHLGAAHVSRVGSIEVGERGLVVEHIGETGHHELCAQGPVVLAMHPVVCAETEATGTARASDIESLRLGQLGLDARELAHRKAAAGQVRSVRARSQPVVVASAHDLIDRLRADGAIAGRAGKP